MTGENILGLALGALMRLPPERKLELRAEALQRTAISGHNDYRRFLIAECIQAYIPLTISDKEEFERLLALAKFKEAQAMTQTYFEEGRQTGFDQGRRIGSEQARRDILKLQLAERFGALSAEVLQRIETWPVDQLTDLLRAAVRAQSLQELGLEG